MLGEQLLGEVDHHGRGGHALDDVLRGGAALGPRRRPGHVVVLDDEDVDLLERVVDVGDLGLELLGAAPHELLEQGQQQLVLAGEVLVEAAQRLAGALDDLLDGEVLVRSSRPSAPGQRRGSAAPASRPAAAPSRAIGPRRARATEAASSVVVGFAVTPRA